jgi:hypothetical protein
MCIIVVFSVLLYSEHKNKTAMPMRELVGRAASAGGLAPALFLIYCAFDVSAICNWSGSATPLALGGICPFYRKKDELDLIRLAEAYPELKRIYPPELVSMLDDI